jgi:N-acyl-D-aspartate/D-glutamate deacylase
VLQLVSDFPEPAAEFGLIEAMVRASGRPLSFSLAQSAREPELYRDLLARIDRAQAAGLPIKAQVAARAVGAVLGLENTLNPFMTNPVLPFLNYAHGNLDDVLTMLQHPHALPGLSDGGAHVGTICDGSFPTALVQHWTRDREGARLELPYVIQRQSLDTARAVGLLDRGVLAPGYRADLNVIDVERLRLWRPEVHADLPAGGRRMVQRAEGYRHTVVAGQETYRDGVETGELPGRLIRGERAVPA